MEILHMEKNYMNTEHILQNIINITKEDEQWRE